MSFPPFTRHVGIAAPLLRPNIDTDAIIPSREFNRVSKEGLGDGLFADWRYLSGTEREPNPDFVLNDSAYRGCSVLLAGRNFGCGSSREYAVWALVDYGFRCVIAPTFGSIFAANAVRCGLLPLPLDEDSIAAVAHWTQRDPPRQPVLIDLEARQLLAGGMTWDFDIDGEACRMLLGGLDAIALTMAHMAEVEDFHRQRQASRPWTQSGKL